MSNRFLLSAHHALLMQSSCTNLDQSSIRFKEKADTWILRNVPRSQKSEFGSEVVVWISFYVYRLVWPFLDLLSGNPLLWERDTALRVKCLLKEFKVNKPSVWVLIKLKVLFLPSCLYWELLSTLYCLYWELVLIVAFGGQAQIKLHQ